MCTLAQNYPEGTNRSETMFDAVTFDHPGDAAVLHAVRLTPTTLGRRDVRIRQRWAGVNFIDVYHRTGLYPVPSLPAILGVEAAGVVEALGCDVDELRVGQSVAWAGLPMGGYAQSRVIAAERVIALPEHVSERVAAGAMLRGLTAHMLLHRVWPVRRGNSILVHAAAGGLGLILTQWAKRLGATVIGTVGSEEKAQVALEAGADHILLHKRENVPARVRELSGGSGVDIVYDGMGGPTLLQSLDCVRPFGLVVSLGQASGSLPEIPLTELGPKRSIAIARPSVIAYATDLASYRAATSELFAALRDGLRIHVGATFPLAEARAAHEALEAGQTSGSLLLDLS
jgi:NADPH2:quinone reductase